VYVHPLANNFPELSERIRAAIISVTPDLLSKTCTEFEYEYMSCNKNEILS